MRTILEAIDLTKDFPLEQGNFRALNNITLTVQEGDVFGIIGESGAGKSTLLKCLSSLEPPSSGALNLYGEPLPLEDKKKLRNIRKTVGMISQHFNLLHSKTVEENIELPLELENVSKETRKLKAHNLLKLVGLEHKKECYPLYLSGGEKQRIAIARALANEPKILFCDEATSALDPKTTVEILDLLKKLNRELSLTLILITHEMSVIRKICNKVAVMDKGEIVEQGSSLEIFSKPKHHVTKNLLQNSTHELDVTTLQLDNPNLLFLKLHFTGATSEKPILSRLISSLNIEVNILSGWIDRVNETSIGTLTIALKGHENKEALSFLENNQISYEVLS